MTSALPQIKICGLSTPETVTAAAEAGADYFGMVHFAKSPRHVSLEQAAELKRGAPEGLKSVLLLVNARLTETAAAIATVQPDVIQFHGTETPEWLKTVRGQVGEVWKALGVKDAATLAKSARYAGAADRLLFDAPAQALPGGTGTSFDWSLLADHAHAVPWGLAGGLDADNVGEALAATNAQLVDVSSGVETAPGLKDVTKIRAFCAAVKAA